MSLYTVLFDLQRTDEFEKNIKPLLIQTDCHFVAYQKNMMPVLGEGSKVLIWLGDEDLYDILPHASQQQWHIGFIPHPEMNRAIRTFFIPEKIETAINDILSVEAPVNVDLMYCNDLLVLGSVVLGNHLTLNSNMQAGENIWFKFKNLAELIYKFRKTRLFPFTLTTAKDVVINTAAMSISVVYRPGNTTLTKRIMSGLDKEDTRLNTIIIAPRSISELVRFLLGSIFFLKKKSNFIPRYMGYINTESITISGGETLSYSVDGQPFNSETVHVFTEDNALKVLSSQFPEKSTEPPQKEPLKVSGLPKGHAVTELTTQTLPWIHHTDLDEVKDTFVTLKENSRISETYLVLMVLSTLLATVGLFANSAPVIIGAMILAPLMSPIISLSMGVLRQNTELVSVSSKTLLVGIMLALLFGTLLTWLIPLHTINHEIDARLSPTILDLVVAIISGIAGAYGSARSEIAKSLAGVAIAVALVPPLAVSGIGIGWLDWSVFSGAFLLFLTNLIGIVLAGAVTFLVMGYSPFHLAKRGMLLAVVFVVVISVPLTFSFSSMVEEQRIIYTLEGWETENIKVQDVKIRSVNPHYISVKLLSSSPLERDQVDAVKLEMERILGHDIRLEATMAVLR